MRDGFARVDRASARYSTKDVPTAVEERARGAGGSGSKPHHERVALDERPGPPGDESAAIFPVAREAAAGSFDSRDTRRCRTGPRERRPRSRPPTPSPHRDTRGTRCRRRIPLRRMESARAFQAGSAAESRSTAAIRPDTGEPDDARRSRARARRAGEPRASHSTRRGTRAPRTRTRPRSKTTIRRAVITLIAGSAETRGGRPRTRATARASAARPRRVR